MPGKKILNVTRVGFHGDTGDDRSPEDFPFPACMASLMEALGEDYPIVKLEAHGRAYTQRTANLDFITASGMAFGLLWHREYCMSGMDLTQVNPHGETIQRAFDWAGYDFEILAKDAAGANREMIRDRIVASIDAGVPALAFGVVGPPECLILCGYDEGGETLVGWSHFAAHEAVEREPNGMFRKADWYRDLWKIVLTGKKTGRKTGLRDVLALGLSVMEKTESEGYAAGLAAYGEWIEYVLNPELDKADDELLRVRHAFHHALTGNLAEARCWGAAFLRRAADGGRELPGVSGAARCFQAIHDECWKVWGTLGEYGQPGVWKGFRDARNRERIAALLGGIKALDAEAADHLRRALDARQ